MRNFFGVLRVSDTGTGEAAVRSLYNGRTIHGLQFLSPARSRLATTYYGPGSGAAMALDAGKTAGRTVGIIGLGAGTLAAYGRRGDHFRFYEINPAVVVAASQYFRFLAESEAETDVVTADGRLALEREPPESFDLIILDAFSDDAIPVHLLTKEAFEADFRHIRGGGILAVHVTNRYLELESVIGALGAALQKEVVIIHNPPDPGRQILAAYWAVLSGDRKALEKLTVDHPPTTARKFMLWTDDYSDLFRILK
jgi:spermidine synthase